MIEEEVVYVRTEEGEAKAKQPRSITSHELRAMLLLIDGRLSVRELRRRFGKSLAIDKSIAELSKLGWVEQDRERGGADLDLVDHKIMTDGEVEAIEESPDTAREEISREAEALARKRAVDDGVEMLPVEADSVADQVEASMFTPDESHADIAGVIQDGAEAVHQSAEPNGNHASEVVDDVLDVASDAPLTDPMLLPTQEPVRLDKTEPVLDLSDEDAGPSPDEPASEETRREPGLEAAEAVADEQVEGATDNSESDAAGASPDEPDPLPEYRGPNIADRARGNVIAARFFMERLWRLFLPTAAVVAVVVLVAAAFLLPERHKEDIAASLERYTGSPASMGDVHLSKEAGGSLAVEHVKLERFPSISVRSLNLVPDWTASIRALGWRFRVRLEGLDGAPDELSRLLKDVVQDGRVSTIEFVDAGVHAGPERWGGYTGAMEMDGQRMVELSGDDRSVTVQVKAMPGGLDIHTVGIRQPVIVFPTVKFDSYELQATMTPDALVIGSFGAAGYGGKITAQGSLTLAPVATLDAQIKLSKVDADRLVRLVGSDMALEGAADATVNVVASAERASEISTCSNVSGDFAIDTGVLGRMDIGAALRERGTGKLQGGETRFETFSGQLGYADGALDLQIRQLDAGALDANGHITIGRDQSLAGRIGAAVASGGRRIRVPVTVSGTVKAPVLETPKPVVAPVKPVKAEPEVVDEVDRETLDIPPDEVPVVPGELR